ARFLIVGTAGHIDHGKTSLIRALTGTDTDRLPEEKRRGMTIELGFAQWADGGLRFGVVDVPGHERFVRTMVAGATGIDLALLVIAADDSVMPQTVEHVEVLDLLGVTQAVIALTKCDLADAELTELVAQDVRELVAGTTLAGSPIVPVSSFTGQGLDDLRRALVATARKVTQRDTQGPFRMAIDRIFTVQGRGTVVTGSVMQGQVAEGDPLELWPEGTRCRVRSLQSHHDTQAMVQGGQRAAINLSGVDRQRITRGCELAGPGYLRPTHILDVELRCLSTATRPIKNRSRLRLCLGTREVMARVVTATGQPLEPGARGFVQFRLGQNVTADFGQRFIVRNESATRTLGGGIILRPSPLRRRIRGDAQQANLVTLKTGQPAERVGQVLAFYGFQRPDDLCIAAEAGVHPDEVGGWIDQLRQAGRLSAIGAGQNPIEVMDQVVGATLERALRWLDTYHRTHPDEPGAGADAFMGYLDRKSRKGLGRALLDRLIESQAVRIQGRYVCHPDHAPALSAQDQRVLAEILDEYDKGGFRPPALTELNVARTANAQRIAKLVKIAVATQQLVEIDKKLYLHADWDGRLRRTVERLIQTGQDASVSNIKQALDSSRKYVVPMLEYLDRVKFTRREGDRRVLCETKP
ncbi:MAG: selenocysteine-specific translation elongation factor, partial [Phycisphaerae bacterium]